MTEAHTSDNSKPNHLAEIHQGAIKAANASWSQTDQLYVSVCSALIALASFSGKPISGSPPYTVVVGVFILLLSANWLWLIGRYRRKILAALKGLALEHKGSGVGDYYCEEHQHFVKDKSDYLIALVVFLMSLVMIFYPIACICADTQA